MAKLSEQSLLTPDDLSSNQVISNATVTFVHCLKDMKIKKWGLE